MTTATVDEAKEKFMRKVQKLLNLAADKKNENESQEAMLMAQRMMLENDITESDLAGVKSAQKKKEVGRVYTDGKKQQYYHKMMAPIIAKNFRCFYYYRTYAGKSQIVFMGLMSDIELAKEMYNFAISALEYNADMYIKEVRQTRYVRDATGIKTDYIRGFIAGLYKKFKDQVAEQSMSLALIIDPIVVEAHSLMKFTKGAGSTGGQNGAGDTDAYKTGFKTGNTMTKASGYIK
jgi:hypothetical protein